MRTFVEEIEQKAYLKSVSPDKGYEFFFHCPKNFQIATTTDARNELLQERLGEAQRWCEREFGTVSGRWGKIPNYAVIGFTNQDDAILFKMRFC